VARLKGLIEEALAAIPDCRGADLLREIVAGEAARLQPKQAARARQAA
jgi:hypothetical protein